MAWSVENWDNQDLWWHDAWSGWYDGSWDVSQTQWCGDGSEWYGYAWTQQEPAKSAEASGSQSNAPEAMNVGSMIISTLVSDLSCEHVDKFVFVDEHDRCETLTQEQEALMREYDSEEALMRELGSGLEVPTQEHDSSKALMRELVSGLEVPTQEHDMKEVLTRELGNGLEVPTREHVIGLDAQVPHEAWFCGLKHGDKIACVGTLASAMNANDEGAVVSSDLCAPVGKRICMVRAHDWFDFRDERSVEHQVEPFLSYLRPLLSQVADNTDASWWLLDSGASTSVLAESNLAAFRSVLQNSEKLGGYRAANGSSVEMAGTAEIGVQMHMSGPSSDDWCWKKARLNILVGSIKQAQYLVNHVIGRFRMEVHSRSERI